MTDSDRPITRADLDAAKRKHALDSISDGVANLLYYDRIEALVESGQLTGQ